MNISKLTATVQSKRLNVRTGPSLESDILGGVQRGGKIKLDTGRLPVTADGFEWYAVDFLWGLGFVNAEGPDFWIAAHTPDRKQRLALLDFEVAIEQPVAGSGRRLVFELVESLADEPLLETVQVEDYVHWIARDRADEKFVAGWDVQSITGVTIE